VFLRQIGHEGLTNYPIGVGINQDGLVLIADNHNNFNVTAFTQDGQMVAAMESRIKHAQCFDVALGSEGSIILASRDFRIYVYNFGAPSVPACLPTRAGGQAMQSSNSSSLFRDADSPSMLPSSSSAFPSFGMNRVPPSSSLGSDWQPFSESVKWFVPGSNRFP